MAKKARFFTLLHLNGRKKPLCVATAQTLRSNLSVALNYPEPVLVTNDGLAQENAAAWKGRRFELAHLLSPVGRVYDDLADRAVPRERLDHVAIPAPAANIHYVNAVM